MNYREALAWLYATQTFGIKLGLDNTRHLLRAVGDPQNRLKFIHVAGTNGKGSICAMLDAMLRADGARTGLYTSPHLLDFRERIRVDGTPIPEQAVAEGLSLLREASSDWDHQPTFFELTTVLAAWWFVRGGVDVVVWETGMGGRLDATNAVTPLVSVIAPIGMDHEKWLGSTLAAIAGEKAGIIKFGVPVVSASQEEEARAVLCAKAAEEHSLIRFVEKPYAGPVGLDGSHQKWNAAVALAALDAAGLVPDTDVRARALAAVEWPARFQRVHGNLVIDGAHNVAAAEVLVAAWRETFGAIKARLIFGALRDKDAAKLLRALRSIADEIWLVPVNNDRGMSPVELRPLAEAAGFPEIRENTVSRSLTEAKASGRPVLVAGSLFLAGEVLALLQGVPTPAESWQ